MTTGHSTNQNSGRGHSFVDDLNSAVRENPVSAALIGMGALWMIIGGNKISAVGQMLPGAAKSVAGAVGSTAEAGARAIGKGLAVAGTSTSDAVRQIGDAVSTGAQSVDALSRQTAASGYELETSSGDKVAEKQGQMARSLGDVVHSSTDAGLNLVTSMQKNLSATLERQPLLLGAIGLAIGAGIASSFRATDTENKLIGETGAALKESIQEFAADTAEAMSTRTKTVFQEATQEAQAQGLTSSAAKGHLHAMADKLKTVVDSTRDSIKDRLS